MAHSRVPRLTWLAGHLPAELGSGGEVGRQLLLDAQGLVVVLLRLLEPARRIQQIAAIEVAAGQILAELGSGGEVGRQLLADAQGLVVVLLRLLQAGPCPAAEGRG